MRMFFILYYDFIVADIKNTDYLDIKNAHSGEHIFSWRQAEQQFAGGVNLFGIVRETERIVEGF